MKKLFIWLFLVSLSVSAWSQKRFNGTITYAISYAQTYADTSELALLPANMEIKVRGRSAKTTIFSVFSPTIILSDAAKKQTHLLISMSKDKKYAISLPQDESVAYFRRSRNVKGAPTGNTREIVGYTCHEVEIADSLETTRGWVTDELYSPAIEWVTQATKTRGIMLAYTYFDNNIEAEFTAIKIVHEKLPPEEFTIGPDYQIVGMDEFQNLVKGTPDETPSSDKP